MPCKEEENLKLNTIMKILILQGSPRANGNTAWMAEEYKKAAEAAGHEDVSSRPAGRHSSGL